MQGYVTSDLDQLKDGLAQTMAVTDIKGRVIANGWIYGTASEIHLLTLPSVAEQLEKHLAPYLRFARCEFKASETPYYLASEETAHSPKLAPFDLWLSDLSQGAIALGEFQVDNDFVLVSGETSGHFLPQMLNLTQHGAVSFSKGCYLGQEVVARAEHRGRVKRGLIHLNNLSQSQSLGTQVPLSSGKSGMLVAKHEGKGLAVGAIEVPLDA